MAPTCTCARPLFRLLNQRATLVQGGDPDEVAPLRSAGGVDADGLIHGARHREFYLRRDGGRLGQPLLSLLRRLADLFAQPREARGAAGLRRLPRLALQPPGLVEQPADLLPRLARQPLRLGARAGPGLLAVSAKPLQVLSSPARGALHLRRRADAWRTCPPSGAESCVALDHS